MYRFNSASSPAFGFVILSLTLGVNFAGKADERQPARRPPNVLVLVADDQRPDTIAALGNSVIQTPNLDRLVREGSVLTRAVCANPICTPSRAEILTGCSGFRNGILDFGGQIDPQLVLWGEAMRRGGYRSYYVGKWHNDGKPTTRGYDETDGLFTGGGGRFWVDQKDWKGREITGYRGWIFQSDDGTLFTEKGVGLTPNISGEFADSAIRLLSRKSDKPFFLHVNFTSPHDPLIMPPGYDEKYDPAKMPLPKNFLPEHPFDHGNFRGRDEVLLPWPRTPADVRDELAMYYRVISHMDQQIGRIFAALQETGQWDNTLIIFTADHGLAIGSHGLRGKQNMYEHTAGVPLIIRGPGISAGKRLAAQIYLREMYPTVCELCGVPIPETVEGKSFAPVLAGKADSIHEQVFCYFRDSQRMIRTDRWKLIHYPQVNKTQLFDLPADPDELHDLSNDPQHAAVLTDLRGKLQTWQKDVGDPLVQSR
jgi:arylsulfatase A-like enzyme